MVDEKTRLIRARNAKRATFTRQNLHQKKRLKDTWRRPRGLQSKQRKQFRAKGPLPTPGYGSPIAVRGFHPSGYEEILVNRVEDLEGLDAEAQAIRIGGTVGNKKREAIQNKALEYGLKVLNLKDASLKITEEEPVEEEEEAEDVEEEVTDDE